jgi:outer membrane protein OmpA-like peptidoglycan-associated protein
MKRFTILTAVCAVILSNSLLAQTDEKGNSYFVVIGAFSIEKNATDFIQAWAPKYGLNPQYKMNVNRNLFYVYTMQDKYWGIPVQEAERIRKLNAKFDKTWVFYGTLDELAKQPTETIVTTATPVVVTPPVTTEIVTPVDTIAATQEPEKEAEKKYFFDLKAEDGTVLKAPIEIIDLDKSTLVALYPSNEPVTIKVFGYRLKQVGINMNSPLDSAGISLEDNTYTVPFELKPLTMGDVTIMYNVFFYKDAGIMRPDSKYEINALVAMMQAHPNRKIVIHGHTNGNYRGKILKMGPNKDFFSTSGAVSENGSATELSEERAKCIQEYLVANGIDKSRMTIKAWGGKKMIHDSEHTRAIENVRVEVEIVKD